MPITIVKKTKPGTKPGTKKAQIQAVDITALVDICGAKHEAWEELDTSAKVLKKEFDESSKEFQDLVVNPSDKEGIINPEDSPEWKGNEYVVKASKCTLTRHIANIKDIFIALENVQEGLALQLMQFKLADLDKYLTKEQLDGLVKSEYRKKRTFKFSKLAKIS